MIVGFTGTQNGLTFRQREALRDYLHSLHAERFHHGDCIGADATAHTFMVRRVPIEIHPSNIKDKRAFCRGATIVHPPKPPLDRNVDIVKVADLMVACPKNSFEEGRSGTWSTARETLRRKKLLTIVWPNGKVQTDVLPDTPLEI